MKGYVSTSCGILCILKRALWSRMWEQRKKNSNHELWVILFIISFFPLIHPKRDLVGTKVICPFGVLRVPGRINLDLTLPYRTGFENDSMRVKWGN